jgi:hypothetical protein
MDNCISASMLGLAIPVLFGVIIILGNCVFVKLAFFTCGIARGGAVQREDTRLRSDVGVLSSPTSVTVFAYVNEVNLRPAFLNALYPEVFSSRRMEA